MRPGATVRSRTSPPGNRKPGKRVSLPRGGRQKRSLGGLGRTRRGDRSGSGRAGRGRVRGGAPDAALLWCAVRGSGGGTAATLRLGRRGCGPAAVRRQGGRGRGGAALLRCAVWSLLGRRAGCGTAAALLRHAVRAVGGGEAVVGFRTRCGARPTQRRSTLSTCRQLAEPSARRTRPEHGQPRTRVAACAMNRTGSAPCGVRPRLCGRLLTRPRAAPTCGPSVLAVSPAPGRTATEHPVRRLPEPSARVPGRRPAQ